MSLGRLVLTVLLVLMLAGCAGTTPRDPTTATEEATAQPAKNPAAEQTQATLTGNETSLPPRARKRPQITGEPHRTATQDREPSKKLGAGASPVETVSVPKNSVPIPADAAQVAQTDTGGGGVVEPEISPGEKAPAVVADAEPEVEAGNMPTQAIASDERPAFADAGAADSGEAAAVASPPNAAGEAAESPRVAMLQPGSKAGDRSKAIDPPKPPSFGERSLDCDVIELMGKFIGQRHIRGEPRKEATDKAIEDVLRLTGGMRDERFVFSGRVYGMLIYRLERSHSAKDTAPTPVRPAGYCAAARESFRPTRARNIGSTRRSEAANPVPGHATSSTSVFHAE